MAAEDGDTGGWRTTCVGAQPDREGRVYALVVSSDGEYFSSRVQLISELVPGGGDASIYLTENWLTAEWLSPGGSLFLVDEDGFVHTNERGGWERIDLRASRGLLWVWGLDDVRVFATGVDGVAWRRTAAGWEFFGQGLEGNIHGLHGRADDDLYAVGTDGGAFHFNGSGWRRLDLPTNSDLHAVLAVGPDEVYVAGARGTFFVGAGDRWRAIEAPATDLFALARYREELYVGLGSAGTWVLAGGELGPAKENVYGYRLAANERFLCAAGQNEAVRHDGTVWVARSYQPRV